MDLIKCKELLDRFFAGEGEYVGRKKNIRRLIAKGIVVIEQNKDKESHFAELANAGHTVVHFIEEKGNKYVGFLLDNNIFQYVNEEISGYEEELTDKFRLIKDSKGEVIGCKIIPNGNIYYARMIGSYKEEGVDIRQVVRDELKRLLEEIIQRL